MTFTEQLKQSRISFCETRATHEFEAQYGEGESATTITITVSVVSQMGISENLLARDIKLVMPIRRVSYAVLRNYPELDNLQRAAVERHLLENTRRLRQCRWWFLTKDFKHPVEDATAYNAALRGRFDVAGVHGNDSLCQYALEKVAELLDAIDELVREWIANK